MVARSASRGGRAAASTPSRWGHEKEICAGGSGCPDNRRGVEEDKVQAFIEAHGVTRLPPAIAHGAYSHKATAYGSSPEQSEWLTGKSTARCNDENLAKAKILTMLQDLGGRIIGENFHSKDTKNKQRIIQDAHRWFFSPSCRQDFEAWCDTAGFEPEYVRDQASKVHANGLPATRAAAGQGSQYHKRKAYREKTRR